MNKSLRFWLGALLISLAMLLLILCSNEETSNSTFIPPEFDITARSEKPDIPEGLPYESATLGEYEVTLALLVAIKEQDAYVYFSNASSNDVWMKVRLLDKNGQIIGESGLIKPSEYLEKVVLKTKSVGSEIVLKVMCYEPNTYHSKGSAQLPLPTIEIH